MRKALGIGSVLAIAALVAVAIVYHGKYRDATEAYVDTKAAEDSVRAHYNASMSALAEIQDNLNAIALEEDQVELLSNDLEDPSGISQSRKDQIVDRIADLNASVQRSKDQIRRLESALRDSQERATGLERMVASLKATLALREATIERLTVRIDSLHVRVAGLETEVRRGQDIIADQQQSLEERRRELDTIRYIVGTRKELKEKGVVLERGGVLGMGRSPQLSANFDEGLFTALDLQTTRSILLPGKKAQVLSAQPQLSYRLEPAGERTELLILDPRAFRSVHHLVVMVE